MGLLPCRKGIHQTVCLADRNTKHCPGSWHGRLLSLSTTLGSWNCVRHLRRLCYLLLHQLDPANPIRSLHAPANHGRCPHETRTRFSCFVDRRHHQHCVRGMVLRHLGCDICLVHAIECFQCSQSILRIRWLLQWKSDWSGGGRYLCRLLDQ